MQWSETYLMPNNHRFRRGADTRVRRAETHLGAGAASRSNP